MTETMSDRSSPQEETFATKSIVIPPSNVQTIIKKTAAYILERGVNTNIEALLIEKDTSGRTAFLNAGHVYNPYYRAYLQFRDDIPEHLLTTVAPQSVPPPPPAFSAPSAGHVSGVSTVTAPVAPSAPAQPVFQNSLYEQLTSHIQAMSLAPSTDAELSSLPAAPAPLTTTFALHTSTSFSPRELAVCRLIALFVARNGPAFVNALMQSDLAAHSDLGCVHVRHPLYTYFHQLIEAYGKIMAPSSHLEQSLSHFITDSSSVINVDGADSSAVVASLQDLNNRLSGLSVASITVSPVYEELRLRMLHRRAEVLRETQNALAEEEENMTMQLIDWHDFSIVATLTFDPMEDHLLPEPETSIERISAALSVREAAMMDEMAGVDETESAPQELMPSSSAAKTSGVQGDVDYSSFGPGGSSVLGKISLDDDDEANLEVVAASTAAAAVKVARSEGLQSQVCPYCGLEVSIDKLEDHIRIELLDPRWREQRQLEAERRKESNEAVGVDISAQVARFNQSRLGGVADRPTTRPTKTFAELIAEQNKGLISDSAVLTQEAQLQQHGSGQSQSTQSSSSTQGQGYPYGYGYGHNQAYNQTYGAAQSDERVVKRAKQDPFAPPPTTTAFAPPPPPSVNASMVQPQQYHQFQSTSVPPLVSTQAPVPVPAPPAPPAPPGLPSAPALVDGLVPEEAWIGMHPGSATVTISLPSMDDSEEGKELGFDGRSISVEVDNLSMSVGAFKKLVCQQVNPVLTANKIKMKVLPGNVFLNKDTFTLAYYNVMNGSVVELGLRTRGGKK